MSMLSSQCDELREAARQFDGYQNGEISRMLREAADTIESLRDSFNEIADSWANAQVDAEVCARENMLLKAHNGTRWHELFGTPERAARTLANNCHRDGCIACAAMGFDCGGGDYDALLGWLREEGETE